MRKVFKPDPALLPGISGDSRFDVDSDGIRGDEMPRGDAYRILAVGGSTTECLYLDQEEALAAPARAQAGRAREGRRGSATSARAAARSRASNVVQVDLFCSISTRSSTTVLMLRRTERLHVRAESAAETSIRTSWRARTRGRSWCGARFYKVEDFEKAGGLSALGTILHERFASSGLPETDPDEVLDDVGKAVQRWREQRQSATTIPRNSSPI
jgi:hypothetical protein